jgi:hypothetical protein
LISLVIFKISAHKSMSTTLIISIIVINLYMICKSWFSFSRFSWKILSKLYANAISFCNLLLLLEL